MVGAAAGHARSRVRSGNEAHMNSTAMSASDTNGWTRSVQEGHGVAHQHGTSEAGRTARIGTARAEIRLQILGQFRTGTVTRLVTQTRGVLGSLRVRHSRVVSR